MEKRIRGTGNLIHPSILIPIIETILIVIIILIIIVQAYLHAWPPSQPVLLGHGFSVKIAVIIGLVGGLEG